MTKISGKDDSKQELRATQRKRDVKEEILWG